MAANYKKWLYVFALGVMCLPFSQWLFHWAPERPLRGLQEVHHKPEFTWDTWAHRSYQDSMELWLGDQFGFRNTLVRLNNEIAFRIFNDVRANGVVVGEEGMLYDQAHINAWTGADDTAQARTLNRIALLKVMHDSLARQGVQLAVVFTASKGYYFPEFIPGHPPEGRNTLYKQYKKGLADAGIPVLDLSQWARDRKDTSRVPLYCKNGIHWTTLGAQVAADTLISFVGRLAGKPVPRIMTGASTCTMEVHGEENDVALGMNLLWDPAPEWLCYAPWKAMGDRSSIKLLSIGDSYYFTIFSAGITHAAFAESHFSFYFDMWHDGSGNASPQGERNAIHDLESHDVVLYFVNDSNLGKMGWGSIETLGGYYQTADPRQRAIDKYSRMMRNDAKWLAEVQEKARQNGISLDEMIRRDAIYLYENVDLKKKGE